ncbi:hypothetical protein CRV24_002841 [Beauveria bassiana]|nr:hypothetical protein CRV24_002841 [Beauveria bassiana]
MVYDWDTHQETCYQLYIQEGRSLEDIMEYLKAAHEFCPSQPKEGEKGTVIMTNIFMVLLKSRFTRMSAGIG